MKPRSTLIMLAVFLAIASYVYFYEMKGGEKRAAEKEASEKLIVMDKDSVSALSFTTSGVSVKKISDKWTIVEPVQTMSDESAVRSIINSLELQKRERELEEQPAAMAGYGLGPTAPSIIVTSQGKQDTIYVGDKNPTGASAYVRVNQESKICLTAAGIVTFAQKTLFDLRDKSVMAFEVNDVTSMKLKSPTLTYDMRKEDGKWILKQPIQALADESKITQLLNGVRNGRIKRFIEEEATDVKPYGLDKPLYEMEIRFGADNTIKALRIGKADKEVYRAQDSSRPPVFDVDSSLVRDLNVKLLDLRERRLNNFQSFDADEFTLEYAGEAFACAKDSAGVWRFAAPDTAKVKSWKASDLLGAVSGLRAESFVENATTLASGLDRPRVTLNVKSKGNEVASLMIGKEQGGMVYAKGSLQPDVVLIKKADADKLFVGKKDLAEEDVKP